MREFHERIRGYYANKYGVRSEQAEACRDGFFFEPHVAERIYTEWLAEAGVDVRTGQVIVGVATGDGRLSALVPERGEWLIGSVFVDASYEGDLLAWAGCSYRVGREGRDEHGESLAGVWYLPEQEGNADGKTQGYDFRLCLTTDTKNQVPFREPRTYDPALYSFRRAQLREGEPPKRLRALISLNPMPNGKTDSRTGEWTGGCWDYPDASREVRRHIAAKHREYAEGYLWFLLTDEAVPKEFRAELATYGYAKDEFVDNQHWPYLMYIREARRMVGDFLMTQRDVTDDRFTPDAVALGSFFLDVHPVRYVPEPTAPGGMVTEGELAEPTRPYEIPYRALLPRRDEVTNLLVPLNVSSSHVAFSTIRMEPVYGMLGHAAGLAAAISVHDGVPVHDVPVSGLRDRLREQGQVLDATPFTETWR